MTHQPDPDPTYREAVTNLREAFKELVRVAVYPFAIPFLDWLTGRIKSITPKDGPQ